MTIEFNNFDYRLLIGIAAAVILLFNLVAVLMALRRVRRSAHASAALVAELAVYKDAAFSLGEHLVRRGSPSQSGPGQSGMAQSPRTDGLLGARHSSLRGADAVALRQPPEARDAQQASSVGASSHVLDTERAVELARRGASVDDLVAACDISRTEAGLILAMTRRGRAFVGRPLLGGA